MDSHYPANSHRQDVGSLSEWVLDKLKCPVCLQYNTGPVQECENHHYGCENCFSRLHHCPLCRGELLGRNRYIESMVRQTRYPCPNRGLGCTAYMWLNQLNPHVDNCTFGIQQCPFNRFAGNSATCSWIGSIEDLEAHIENKHSRRTLFTDVVRDTYMGMTSYVVLVHGKIFLYHKNRTWTSLSYDDGGRHNKGTRGFYTWYVAVLLMGTPEEASRFSVKFTLTEGAGSLKEVTETWRVHSVVDDIYYLFYSGKTFQKCHRTLNNFNRNHVLKLTARIVAEDNNEIAFQG